jgi:glutamate synthase domain-containing protein 2
MPDGLDKIPVDIITQRIVNLMSAWHSQLLEVMGAMGIREARRLRGETGRAIFFEEIDREIFGKLFKQK